MATEIKPELSKKDTPKTVSLSDFLAFKKGSLEREKQLKRELDEAKADVAKAQEETSIFSIDVDDEDEVKSVKKYLLEEKRKVDAERAKSEKTVTSLEERERKVMAKELASDYKERGMEITADELLGEDDMNRYAQDKYGEFLAEKEEGLNKAPEKEEPSAEEKKLYESEQPGIIKKSAADMKPEEFDAAWDAKMKEALSKR